MPSRIDVTRKRPTRWPWAVGAALAFLAIWGITSLLTGPPDPEPEITVPTVEDTHPPAAIPRPTRPGIGSEATRPVQDVPPDGGGAPNADGEERTGTEAD